MQQKTCLREKNIEKNSYDFEPALQTYGGYLC